MADPTPVAPAHTVEPAPGPEDAKLATLARATRARTQAPAGAAVRDLDGRTYAAADVALASLTVGALDLAVAMAVSSGARGLEAALVVADALPDVGAVRDLAGTGVPVFRADASGTVVEGSTT
ncbi:MAG: cytidine deaminase [Propionibacteriales bacterium]|nr:cytidine deaminase [Propionibacteriales bacterium]